MTFIMFIIHKKYTTECSIRTLNDHDVNLQVSLLMNLTTHDGKWCTTVALNT